ncbi:NADH-quinone oxidoreductase subunit A [Levilinea saccharolytica]|uniref:NADH-quinone oxidoreductase subunit A n=1 Tax=Levilinea saccharolytica TaxID=229921 RepID=A0A0P6XWN0_9CHLR|nr:NADH-quinone oxidoreductase subunit A [Levilinea saccharolytica]KPL79856.1 NADH-quinone oxidoreductase subunit A [Levilinea saccharolytica]KPL79863.1 NADH-quinone oxidoreductase subunit A [Levilinea saccharolytica]GAP16874.1 NADH dehydrogenase subunit A [Levilinea saccharolytica]
MIEHYLPLFVILGLAVFVGVLVVVLGTIFGPKRPTERKSSPYESGMVPYGPGRRRMSVRYYLVAVLFILFDIEVIFVLPWAVTFRDLGMPGLWLMIVFLLVLEVAYVYAWKKGALEWE